MEKCGKWKRVLVAKKAGLFSCCYACPCKYIPWLLGPGGSKIIHEMWPVRGPVDLNWGRDWMRATASISAEQWQTETWNVALESKTGTATPWSTFLSFLSFPTGNLFLFIISFVWLQYFVWVLLFSELASNCEDLESFGSAANIQPFHERQK